MTYTTHPARSPRLTAACLPLLLRPAAAPARAQYPDASRAAAAGRTGVRMSGAWQSGAPSYSVGATRPPACSSIAHASTVTAVPQRWCSCRLGMPSTATLASATCRRRASPMVSTRRRCSATDAGGASNAVLRGRCGSTTRRRRRRAASRSRAAWAGAPARPARVTGRTRAAVRADYGVRYRLCPAEADSSDPTSPRTARPRACKTSVGQPSRTFWRAGPMTELPDGVRLPGPGLWTLRVWLVDAAGNRTAERGATVVTGLGYDPTPPQVAGFAEQDPNDPARVTVARQRGRLADRRRRDRGPPPRRAASGGR